MSSFDIASTVARRAAAYTFLSGCVLIGLIHNLIAPFDAYASIVLLGGLLCSYTIADAGASKYTTVSLYGERIRFKRNADATHFPSLTEIETRTVNQLARETVWTLIILWFLAALLIVMAITASLYFFY